MGPRFVDMTTPFDVELRHLAAEGAKALGFEVKKRGLRRRARAERCEDAGRDPHVPHPGWRRGRHEHRARVVAARHAGRACCSASCHPQLKAAVSVTRPSPCRRAEVAERVRERFVALLGAVLRRLL
ncbi:MAG: hypothetical protein R3B99_17345 [Polyangiales bacterium]